jgi:phosphoribosylformylglycinamidine synthase
MLCLRGAPALSDARRLRLLARLRAVRPSLRDLDSQLVYLVDASRPLEAREESILEALVREGLAPSAAAANRGVELFVIPRIGTISPWSSKATEIVHRCGLDAIRRIERATAYGFHGLEGPEEAQALAGELHDRMTEMLLDDLDRAAALFERAEPRPYRRIEVLARGHDAIREADGELGLALAADEIDYLVESFRALADGVLSAYSDNASVIAGSDGGRFGPDPESGRYVQQDEPAQILMKVETHNHPTAISPFPGAATGSGGEIRDEGATGRGGKPKAGLTGFSVSNLLIPDAAQPWERDPGRPGRIASALEIMLEGPIGGAAFNNEFGRPNLAGYFRTYCQEIPGAMGPEISCSPEVSVTYARCTSTKRRRRPVRRSSCWVGRPC